MSTETESKTRKIIAIKDCENVPLHGVVWKGEIVDFPIDEPPPPGFRDATWQDFVNVKTFDKVKRFIHPLTIDRLRLQICIPPSQYAVLKNFTFYRIEADVTKKKDTGVFTFYLTDYDAREDKGGYADGIIPNDCWCLFTFYEGRRAIQFFTPSAINDITPEQMNAVLQRMFDSLQ